MAMKSIVLVILLVTVLVASQAEAQSPPPPLSGLIRINANISCSLNGNIVPSATTPTPPFANARVLLSCAGIVISSNVTNEQGMLAIAVNQLQINITNLLSSCKVIVATPLASCDANITAPGLLESPLQIQSITTVAGQIVTQLVAMAFKLVNI